MPHMTIYGAKMDRKWCPNGPEVPSVRHSICLSVQKWTGSVRPKHFTYFLDEPYARELQHMALAP